MWADGVHPKVRLEQAHSCVLVLMGVCQDGTEELIAPAEGLRESAEGWADPLRDCRRRGMRDPELVVGDGAMRLAEEGAGGGLPGRTPSAVPGPQGPARRERPAAVRTAGRDEGGAGDLQRRDRAGSPAAALPMVFKLVESAQTRRRAIRGAHLVALVRAGARFEKVVLTERPEARIA